MTDFKKHHALPAPCKSCPYREDVPSGVWAELEYKKLPAYDGEIAEQAIKGATSLFLCHQRNNALCSGWLACHGPDNLLAMRLHYTRVDASAFDYTTKIPVFASGEQAAAHGMRDIDEPGIPARRVMKRLTTKLQKGTGDAGTPDET